MWRSASAATPVTMAPGPPHQHDWWRMASVAFRGDFFWDKKDTSIDIWYIYIYIYDCRVDEMELLKPQLLVIFSAAIPSLLTRLCIPCANLSLSDRLRLHHTEHQTPLEIKVIFQHYYLAPRIQKWVVASKFSIYSQLVCNNQSQKRHLEGSTTYR